MKKAMLAGMVVVLMLGLAACGSSGSGSGTDADPSFASVSELPRITAPVVSASANSLSANVLKADVGMSLGSISESDFSTSSSMSACENFNHIKSAISAAAQADLILCYIQGLNYDDVVVDDGEYHAFGLDLSEDGEEEGASPDHVRFKIARDDAGSITEFELFACRNGAIMEYLRQAIDGNAVTITEKGQFASDGGGSGQHQADVVGTLNADGEYISKSVTVRDVNNMPGGGSHSGMFTIDQDASLFTTNGFQNGNWIFDGNSGSYEDRAACLSEVIDANPAGAEYDIGLLAVGDGACKVAHDNSSNIAGSDDVWTQTFEEAEGYLGDSPFSSDVSMLDIFPVADETLPVVEAVVIDLSDIDYACDGEEEALIAGDNQEMKAACLNYDLGHNWIDCWNTIDPMVE